jgi:hypothetical protein
MNPLLSFHGSIVFNQDYGVLRSVRGTAAALLFLFLSIFSFPIVDILLLFSEVACGVLHAAVLDISSRRVFIAYHCISSRHVEIFWYSCQLLRQLPRWPPTHSAIFMPKTNCTPYIGQGWPIVPWRFWECGGTALKYANFCHVLRITNTMIRHLLTLSFNEGPRLICIHMELTIWK